MARATSRRIVTDQRDTSILVSATSGLKANSESQMVDVSLLSPNKCRRRIDYHLYHRLVLRRTVSIPNAKSSAKISPFFWHNAVQIPAALVYSYP